MALESFFRPHNSREFINREILLSSFYMPSLQLVKLDGAKKLKLPYCQTSAHTITFGTTKVKVVYAVVNMLLLDSCHYKNFYELIVHKPTENIDTYTSRRIIFDNAIQVLEHPERPKIASIVQKIQQIPVQVKTSSDFRQSLTKKTVSDLSQNGETQKKPSCYQGTEHNVVRQVHLREKPEKPNMTGFKGLKRGHVITTVSKSKMSKLNIPKPSSESEPRLSNNDINNPQLNVIDDPALHTAEDDNEDGMDEESLPDDGDESDNEQSNAEVTDMDVDVQAVAPDTNIAGTINNNMNNTETITLPDNDEEMSNEENTNPDNVENYLRNTQQIQEFTPYNPNLYEATEESKMVNVIKVHNKYFDPTSNEPFSSIKVALQFGKSFNAYIEEVTNKELFHIFAMVPMGNSFKEINIVVKQVNIKDYQNLSANAVNSPFLTCTPTVFYIDPQAIISGLYIKKQYEKFDEIARKHYDIVVDIIKITADNLSYRQFVKQVNDYFLKDKRDTPYKKEVYYSLYGAFKLNGIHASKNLSNFQFLAASLNYSSLPFQALTDFLVKIFLSRRFSPTFANNLYSKIPLKLTDDEMTQLEIDKIGEDFNTKYKKKEPIFSINPKFDKEQKKFITEKFDFAINLLKVDPYIAYVMNYEKKLGYSILGDDITMQKSETTEDITFSDNYLLGDYNYKGHVYFK